ncbi:hypothetical protein ACL9RF_05135 [Sphingobacterium sp. Mn56C]|uniref:hypothetical protein n=1 Tax=Sphingobacterium sp. Mn56C TaxID=3395261 RepID=UPI003BDFB1C4
MKISGNTIIISALKEALISNLYASAFASKCDIVLTDRSVEFIPREALTAKDWFYLGYFVREYVK